METDAQMKRMANLVLGACGVPAILLNPDASAASVREGLRLLEQATIEPIARQIQSEVSEKLNAADLLVGDISRPNLRDQAQAISALVVAGVTLEEARKIARLG